MARIYRPRTSQYRAHGEGLAKAYNLTRRDVRAKRAGRPYERTGDPNRQALRNVLDALERDFAARDAELVRLTHRALRDSARRDGRPPRHFVLTHDGRIFTSRDPNPLPREVVAEALARKMKAVARKNR